jgi:hypothetical protein
VLTEVACCAAALLMAAAPSRHAKSSTAPARDAFIILETACC